MAARARSGGGVGFGVRDRSRLSSAAAGGGAVGKVAPRGVASVGEGAEERTGEGGSASVSMAESDSEPSLLGREGVVRSSTLRFLRFLMERVPAIGEGLERELGGRATEVRAWASRRSGSSCDWIFNV